METVAFLWAIVRQSFLVIGKHLQILICSVSQLKGHSISTGTELPLQEFLIKLRNQSLVPSLVWRCFLGQI